MRLIDEMFMKDIILYQHNYGNSQSKIETSSFIINLRKKVKDVALNEILKYENLNFKCFLSVF